MMTQKASVSRRGILAVASGVIAAMAVRPKPAAAQDEDLRARILAAVPRAVLVTAPLVVTVRCQVPMAMVGQQAIIRVTMLTDTTEIRYKYESNPAQITAPTFQVNIANGANDPVEDWNLIGERIHVMKAPINVVGQAVFGTSIDYPFKVLNA
jgi:hypothetical protein